MDRRLDYLKTLFDLLPDNFPSPPLSDSEFFELQPFELDSNLLKRTDGDIPEAISQHLHAIFYADGEISITERGPVVSAVVTVLNTYLHEFPFHQKLLRWQERLIKALEHILRENGITVRRLCVLSDRHREEKSQHLVPISRTSLILAICRQLERY